VDLEVAGSDFLLVDRTRENCPSHQSARIPMPLTTVWNINNECSVDLAALLSPNPTLGLEGISELFCGMHRFYLDPSALPVSELTTLHVSCLQPGPHQQPGPTPQHIQPPPTSFHSLSVLGCILAGIARSMPGFYNLGLRNIGIS
jgi:hypothetical protein